MFQRILLCALLATQGVAAYGQHQDHEHDEVIAASDAYLRAVDTQFRAARRTGAVSMGQKALWVERAANRIYDLPTMQVDDELVSFGLEAADRLYNVAQMYRDVGIQSGYYYRENHSYRFYWDFWMNRRFGLGRDYATRMTVARDAARFFNEQKRWQRRTRADIRRALSKRYHHDF